jgi:hypothetical protein
MTEEERNKLSNSIVCEECMEIANFRKESCDGKKACFYANHLEDCGNASGSYKRSADGDEEVSI